MTCESCGAEVADLQPVHRTYVTAGARDRAERVVADIEHFACLTHYPHEPA
jgi:hypothetical protein